MVQVEISILSSIFSVELILFWKGPIEDKKLSVYIIL